MFESSLYGLSNPALYKDIGETLMEQQLGITPQVQDACCSLPQNSMLNNPTSDTVTLNSNSKHNKKDKIIFGSLLATGALAIFAALKFGKNIGSSLVTKIKKVFHK